MNRKRTDSLRFRLFRTVLIALLVCAMLFAVTGRVSAGIIRRYLLSDSAIRARSEVYLADFREYVSKYQVASTDREALTAWCRTHSGLSLTVLQNDQIIFEGENEGHFDSMEFPFVLSIGPGSSGAAASVNEPMPVQFSNGHYLVTIVDTNKTRYYLMGTCISVVVAAIGFLSVLALYNRRITQSVIQLSDEVKAASRGELTHEIPVRGHDEFAELAKSINRMRASVIEQTQQEAIAWQANRDLITSLSHDLRTPLTTLIGYLNLIADGEYASPDELRQYANTALNKAMRLKTLSDELFRYFLVYGRPTDELKMEEYDAQVLLEQLLGERTLLMMEQGYTFRKVNRVGNCRIRTNADSLMRVFDNLFSNLSKYADPAKPIILYMAREDDRLHITISNGRQKNPTQSTQIGLATCRKLMADLGGTFRAEPDAGGQTFTAELTLPVCTEPA